MELGGDERMSGEFSPFSYAAAQGYLFSDRYDWVARTYTAIIRSRSGMSVSRVFSLDADRHAMNYIGFKKLILDEMIEELRKRERRTK